MRRIIFGCLSSRSGSVHVAGHTTGQSVHLCIRGRRQGGGTRGSLITPARHVLGFVMVTARKVTRANTVTVFSSAGSTPPITVHSPARTVSTATAASASLPTRQISSASSAQRHPVPPPSTTLSYFPSHPRQSHRHQYPPSRIHSGSYISA